MTISSSTNRVSYNGNGSTTVFAFPYLFYASGDLKVTKVAANGTETLLAETTHYSVGGAGSPSGGTVTMVTAPVSGEKLVVVREVAYTQELDLVPNDPLPADSLEKRLDLQTMMAQQVKEITDRTLKFPKGDSTSLSAELPAATIRANKAVVFDASGNVGASTDDYNDQLANVTAQAVAAAASAATATTQAGISTAQASAAASSRAAADADAAATAADRLAVASDKATVAADKAVVVANAAQSATDAAAAALSASQAGTAKTAAEAAQTAAAASAADADVDAATAAAAASTATVKAGEADASATAASSSAADAQYWAEQAQGGANSFSIFAVSGQANVVADQAGDTLTLAAGTGVTLTTDAATDTITIAVSSVTGAHGLKRNGAALEWTHGTDPFDAASQDEWAVLPTNAVFSLNANGHLEVTF